MVLKKKKIIEKNDLYFKHQVKCIVMEKPTGHIGASVLTVLRQL